MTTLPISSIAALAPAAASHTSAPSPKSSSLASQDVFLQLLISQLKNQDPSQPTDGAQFVTQLAQFTTLQETTKGTSDLDKLVAALPPASSTTTSSGGTTKTNS